MVGRDVAPLVRAVAHGAMGRRIDHSRWIYLAISRSSLCSTTGVTKTVVCAILSVGMMNIKEPLLLIGKRTPCGDSWLLLTLSEWSFTICMAP